MITQCDHAAHHIKKVLNSHQTLFTYMYKNGVWEEGLGIRTGNGIWEEGLGMRLYKWLTEWHLLKAFSFS